MEDGRDGDKQLLVFSQILEARHYHCSAEQLYTKVGKESPIGCYSRYRVSHTITKVGKGSPKLVLGKGSSHPLVPKV